MKIGKMVLRPEDQADFKKYSPVRGTLNYIVIADNICNLRNLKEIDYETVMQVVRYEKRLKNLLYIYLGTFEDYLKSQLFTWYFKSKGVVGTKKQLKLTNDSLTLGGLITNLFNEKLINEKVQSDYLKVKDLRNKVMHFNYMLVELEFNENNDDYQLEDIRTRIAEDIYLLAKYIPEFYQEGFYEKLKKCNHKVPMILDLTIAEAIEEVKGK